MARTMSLKMVRISEFGPEVSTSSLVSCCTRWEGNRDPLEAKQSTGTSWWRWTLP